VGGRFTVFWPNPNFSMTTRTTHPSPVTRGFARCLALLSLVFLTLTGGLKAQDFEGKTIAAIEIRYQGSQTVGEARIRNRKRSKVGPA